MSKITNGGLSRSGTGCFIAVPTATLGVKGLRGKNGRSTINDRRSTVLGEPSGF